MNHTALLAADFRAVGLTVAALVFIAFVAMFIRNIFTARRELGSEIELAPNRKPYLADEDLEGSKLDRSLTFALIMLAILAVVLPFYWLAEPGRQDGAKDAYQLKFEVEGETTFTKGAQCVNCHAAGGIGGQAPYVLQDADGQFLANANWYAPSLNDVLLRYSEEEVTYVLNYGRPGSPMAAWGTPGGGPLTTQQVQNVIEYLRTLQLQTLDPVAMTEAAGDDEEALAEMQAEADDLVADIREEVDRSLADGEFETVGEAVFNLGLHSGYRNGALSCARCHTSGWSLGPDASPDVLEPGVAGCGGGDPSGIGFNLCNGAVKNRFPDDTWKRADGSWNPVGGLADDDGFYVEAADGSKIRLDEGGNPITDDGDTYFIIDEPSGDAAAETETGTGTGAAGTEGVPTEEPAVDTTGTEADEGDDAGLADEAVEGEEAPLDETGTAVDDQPDENEAGDTTGAGEAGAQGDTDTDTDAAGGVTASTEGFGSASAEPGDLADCDYVSQLWQTQAGEVYPFGPDVVVEYDEDTGTPADPPELDPAEVPGDTLTLSDGRLAGDCTVVAMPDRTSQAHFDFIFNGAEAGAGYGRGGLSAAGMMPGFGAVLPPDYIQAVVDYERGL